MRCSSYRLVSRTVGREYALALLVSFSFFFFVFFVNQILLVVQKIAVKNVSLSAILRLVSLAIPQFLLYTFPFSSLMASSMVLGDMSSSNEILALRASGISMKRVFAPILVLSFLLSCLTFWVADSVLPRSHIAYQEMYKDMMRDLPTLELVSYGTNTIGDQTITNGQAEGDRVQNLVLFSDTKKGASQVVTAGAATIRNVDPANFVYSLDLEKPEILITDSQSGDWTLSRAEGAEMYLDFSAQVPEASSTRPSQLSIAELDARIAEREKDAEHQISSHDRDARNDAAALAAMCRESSPSADRWKDTLADYGELTKEDPIVFYYQYYRAEKNKKLALSLACFLLVFLTFPLAFFRVKHGRLIGFGIAMLAAVAYWYLLLFAQISVFHHPVNPALLMWAPDVLMFLTGIVILQKVRK